MIKAQRSQLPDQRVALLNLIASEIRGVPAQIQGPI